jgi:hypothetical protein
MEPYLGGIRGRTGTESPLWQTPLQRHLTALETDLAETAGARMLPLVATTTGLT